MGRRRRHARDRGLPRQWRRVPSGARQPSCRMRTIESGSLGQCSDVAYLAWPEKWASPPAGLSGEGETASREALRRSGSGGWVRTVADRHVGAGTRAKPSCASRSHCVGEARWARRGRLGFTETPKTPILWVQPLFQYRRHTLSSPAQTPRITRFLEVYSPNAYSVWASRRIVLLATSCGPTDAQFGVKPTIRRAACSVRQRSAAAQCGHVVTPWLERGLVRECGVR